MVTPRAPSLAPQLCMRRGCLDGLPPVEPPEGYTVRTYQPGDDAAWCKVVADAFGRECPLAEFHERMETHAAFRPDRVFLVFSDREPAATASAWHRPDIDPHAGYLHMVGCRPCHRGKRLGYTVSVAALHKIAEDGRHTALLHTDDFRLPAIKTYLVLGFEPVLVHENQRERWPKVFEDLGRPELIERFRAQLDAAIFTPAKC